MPTPVERVVEIPDLAGAGAPTDAGGVSENDRELEHHEEDYRRWQQKEEWRGYYRAALGGLASYVGPSGDAAEMVKKAHEIANL